jgi:hypothetical protein
MNDIVEDPSITWEIQGLITFAAYWKDPLNYQAYLLNNNFLAGALSDPSPFTFQI